MKNAFNSRSRFISCLMAGSLAAVVAGALAAPAAADPAAALAVPPAQRPPLGAQQSSVRVSLAGIDLNTPEGRDLARGKLRKTARTVCARVADELDLSHQSNFVKCEDDAVAKAMQQVDALARNSAPQHAVASN
jgi:UrcA family protein